MINKSDEDIIKQAKERFKRAEDYENDARNNFIADMKFADGDSDNNYQWPDTLYSSRGGQSRPCLTINVTRQHNLMVTNDAKQNKPGISIRATGGEATKEAADIYEGICRYIERQSKAEDAYSAAGDTQVAGGIGYWRIDVDYPDNEWFDQEIYINPIFDPLSVYLDPDAKQKDKSDGKFAFVFTDMSLDEYNNDYPDDKRDPPSSSTWGGDPWIGGDYVRVAEYFRRQCVHDKLVAFIIPESGKQEVLKLSQIPKDARKVILESPDTKTRPIKEYKIEWFKIAGDKIIDRRELLGQHIPIVALIGCETVINGQMDRKGHTRAMKDPQRMLNYHASGAVEFGALQSKAPFIAPARAIEGLETYWNKLNTENPAILPYNDTDDAGAPIAAPVKMQPPTSAPFYEQAMVNAAMQIQMVSGQFQAQMGEESNERSGKAINERQRQGDNATYHFIDNLGVAIRRTGEILIDLIPKVYDTERVIHILGEDGTENLVKLDPNAAQAHMVQEQIDKQKASIIFNPNVGKYAVEADMGPAYATQRQQAFDAFLEIATRDPAIMPIIGDILFRNMDVPGADELAERMKNMVPPQALGEAANPAMQQMQGQMQKMGETVAKLTQENISLKISNKGKDEQKDIDVYNAETERLNVLLDFERWRQGRDLSSADVANLWHEWNMQERGSQLDQINAANQASIAQQAQPRSNTAQ